MHEPIHQPIHEPVHELPEYEPASVLLEKIKEERLSAVPSTAQAGKKKLGKKYKELPPVDTTELPELPEGWVWVRLGEITNDIQYGYTAKAINEPIGPKMLRITDIQDNNVDWNNVPYCVIESNEEKKYLLNEGDLVFARTGATVGKSFLIKGKIPKSIFASYLIRIVLSKKVFEEYVYNFFQSYEYWKQILSNQLGIGQPNVNSQILSKIILPLPPLPEQQQIVEEIERRFSVLDEMEKAIDNSLKEAEQLRQSILKRAFEGKLVPQDPNDEPAEELLERIKEGKAKRESEKKVKKKGGR
ncbi:MAG: restriction endonuclease subunit S [Nitrospirae bacterium]|nr:restriction endonuclease subunit S [Nitrospirota bacterium]